MRPVYVQREMLKLWCANLLPRWLVYWAGIRIVSEATTGEYEGQALPVLTAMEALKRF